jgi:hypothetical protein
MVGMLLAHNFDAKSVKEKGKEDRMACVSPEAMFVVSRTVAILGEVF